MATRKAPQPKKKPAKRKAKKVGPQASKDQPGKGGADTELKKPAVFVPKINSALADAISKNEEQDDQIRGRGRPSPYDPETHPAIAQAMTAAHSPEYAIAAHFGISPTTMWAWKAVHPEFLKALDLGKAEQVKALKATALQRALGYSYETQKAFQTGVVVTITETIPPSEKMLQYLLNNMSPEEFSSEKKLTLSADEAFVTYLEEMNKRAMLKRLPPRQRQIIDVKAVPVGAE